MAGFLGFFEKRPSRESRGTRGSRGMERLALALELLEPRQLLAADGFGLIAPCGQLWQPEGTIGDRPAAISPASSTDAARLEVSQNENASTANDRTVLGDAHELVYLEDIAEALGEAIEIEGADAWWCDGDWHDAEPF